MTKDDLVYLAIIAVSLLLDRFVLWSSFVRRAQADPRGARLRLWTGWMIMLWTLTAFGVGIWLFESRDCKTLRLMAPHGWRMWGASGLVLALCWAYARSIIRIARSKGQKRIKWGHPDAERLSPRTRFELLFWFALSLSAGFCEEFIFRGYLLWAFRPVFGLWGAAGISIAVFALAHAHQGAKGILGTGAIAVLLTTVVLISQSLWPAIVLHTLIDLGQGSIGWLVVRRGPSATGEATV